MTQSEVYNKIRLIEDIKPNSRWVEKNRSVLLSIIKKEVAGQSELKTKNLFIQSLNLLKSNIGFIADAITPHRLIDAFGRSAIASVSGMAILLAGIAIIHSANGTVPGKILYPIKIANENMRLSWATDSVSKARLEIDFAGRRIEELEKLVNTNTSNSNNQNINTATVDLKTKMQTANDHLSELNNNTDSKIAINIAKDIDKKVSQYTTSLDSMKQNKTVNQQEISDVLVQVSDVSDTALGVMISKNSENNDAVNDLDLVEKLNNKIALIEKEASDISTEQVFNDAKELINKGDFAAAMIKIEEGKDIIKKMRAELAKQAVEAKKEVEVVPVPVIEQPVVIPN